LVLGEFHYLQTFLTPTQIRVSGRVNPCRVMLGCRKAWPMILKKNLKIGTKYKKNWENQKIGKLYSGKHRSSSFGKSSFVKIL